MCGVCGFPSASGHWTDAGTADTPHDRVRARLRRAQVLQSVLPAYGLSAHDGTQVPGIVVSTQSGNQYIACDVSDVWTAADRMGARPIDPLDPRFLGPEE